MSDRAAARATTPSSALAGSISCRRQTSLRAGTLFSKSLLPLTKWFQAMWLITQSKNSISSLELSRQLGVKYDSAWLMRQKLAAVMGERESTRKLDGRVEMDDAVMGRGERRAGRRGRGGPNKTPFVIAVETRDGKPRRVQMHVVAGFTSAEIERVARAHLEPAAIVVSDGLACFGAVKAAGCEHEPVNVSKTLTGRSETLACFRWVNTLLGNVKTALSGTMHAVRPRYVFRYLAEFQYRFNRRFKLSEMLDRLAYVASRAAPRPYRSSSADPATRSRLGSQGAEEARGLGAQGDRRGTRQGRGRTGRRAQHRVVQSGLLAREVRLAQPRHESEMTRVLMTGCAANGLAGDDGVRWCLATVGSGLH